MMTLMLSWLATASPAADLLLKLVVLIAVAHALHAGLGRVNPRWRVVLWRAAFAGAIALPICVLMAPRLEVAIAPPAAASAAVPAPPIEEAEPSVVPPIQQATMTPAQLPAAAPDMRVSLPVILAVLWVIPAAFLLIRSGLGIRAARRLIRESSPAPAAWEADVARLSAALQLKRPMRVAVSSRVSTPLLCGVRQPAILLPCSLAADADDAQRRGVIAHELAHTRGNDLAWFAAFEILRAVLWFVPLAWWMPRLHERACEEVADAVAAEHTGGREGYSRTLALVALAAVGKKRRPATISMAARADVLERLERLRRTEGSRALRPKPVAFVCGFGILLIVAMGCARIAQAQATNQSPPSGNQDGDVAIARLAPASGVVPQEPIAGPSTTPEQIRERLEVQVKTLDFDRAPLSSVLKQIADAYQFNILFDPEADRIGEQLVTARLSGTTLKDALTILLHSKGLNWEIDEQGFVKVVEGTGIVADANTGLPPPRLDNLAVGTSVSVGMLNVRLDELDKKNSDDSGDDTVKIVAGFGRQQEIVTLSEGNSADVFGGKWTIIAEKIQANKHGFGGHAQLRAIRNWHPISAAQKMAGTLDPFRLVLNEECMISGMRIKLLSVEKWGPDSIKEDLARFEVTIGDQKSFMSIMKGGAGQLHGTDKVFVLHRAYSGKGSPTAEFFILPAPVDKPSFENPARKAGS